MKHTRIIRNIALGVENLLLHKLRSFLTMLGVVFGVGSVVAMLSVGEGASKEALEQIRKLGSNNIIISSVKSAEDQSTSTKRSHMSIYGLTYMDHIRITESFDSIEKCAPVKVMRKDSRLGERTLELRVVGTTPEWFELVRRAVIAGRVLLKSDQEGHDNVAVLTEFGARKLLATEGTIGKTIRIGGDYFKVVGIVKSESGQAGNIQLPDQKVDVYIPIEVAKAYFGDVFTKRTSGSRIREKVELHQIIVQTNATENVESTAAGIEAMLSRFHAKKDYLVSVPLALLRQAEATKRTFNIVLGSIAGISLLVGGGDRAHP
jgi:putative ABC transport system permease protein